MAKHEITARLRMGTPLIIASGSPRWGADLATAADEDGYPFIPGTSLRGRLRHWTRLAANTLGLFSCDEPDPERMCGAREPDPNLPGVVTAPSFDGGTSRRFCAVCRLFGSPQMLPSRVWVTDLRMGQGNELEGVRSSVCTQVRSHVALNRKRRVAESGKLFAVEATSPGLEAVPYEGTILVRLPEEDAALMGLLVAALAQCYTVGGQNSRGYGWVEAPGVSLGSETGTDACFTCTSYTIEQAQDDLRSLLALAGGEG